MLMRSRFDKFIKDQSGRKIKRLPRPGVIVCLEMIGEKNVPFLLAISRVVRCYSESLLVSLDVKTSESGRANGALRLLGARTKSDLLIR